MTNPKQSLIDRLKEQSDTMLVVLECKPTVCGEYRHLMMGLNIDYCPDSFSYLRNVKGKSKVFNLCYRECQRHKSYIGWE